MIIYSALYPAFAHLDKLDNVDKWEVVYEPDDIKRKDAILILHGGADISPSLYGEKPNKHTYADPYPSNRDRVELKLYHKAQELGIPIYGICRGAQLLCVLNGGKLIQHVTGHNSEHRITTIDGVTFKSNSAHHQMMSPGYTDHELIAWTTHPQSNAYLGEDEKHLRMVVEPEIVFFPKTKALGIQGHPEWLTPKSMLVVESLKLIKEKLVPHVMGS